MFCNLESMEMKLFLHSINILQSYHQIKHDVLKITCLYHITYLYQSIFNTLNFKQYINYSTNIQWYQSLTILIQYKDQFIKKYVSFTQSLLFYSLKQEDQANVVVAIGTVNEAQEEQSKKQSKKKQSKKQQSKKKQSKQSKLLLLILIKMLYHNKYG